MEWLTENWLWILLGIGFVWLLSRGRAGMGCCGAGHVHGRPNESTKQEGQEKPAPTKTSCH
jgi:hypothetical protein